MSQADAPTPFFPNTQRSSGVAVLVSGGLDSAILVAEMAKSRRDVFPLYIRGGLAWETEELEHLHRFLKEVHTPSLRSLTSLDVPVADLYGNHWSITGRDVPGPRTGDDAVYLPGRNVLLLTKTMIWCHLHQVSELALGVLKSNPFPDATPAFLAALEHVINRAIDGKTQVVRPYAELSKPDVLQRGRGLPLQFTFSCIRPMNGRHCGVCNKCAERRRAFLDAGMPDPTTYAMENPCTV